MEVERFNELVDEAVASIPEEFRSKLDNVMIDVRPIAAPDVYRNLSKNPWGLLGVYQGVPYADRGPWYGNVLPDRILIFQKPIERQCRNDAEVRKLIRYFGLSDDELHRLEDEADDAEAGRAASEEGPGESPSPR
jgi:predicted Zn-dependent protease with MMP-like domain